MTGKHEYEELERRVKVLEEILLRLERSQMRLRDSNQQWETIFEAIDDPVSLLDAECKILRCNKAMTTFLEKPVSEVMGQRCWELVHGTTEPIEGCPIVRMCDTRHKESAVLPIEGKWFKIVVHPQIDAQGNIIEVVHTLSEITEYRRAEKALKESEERSRELAELLPQPVFEIDMEGFFTYSNRSGFETFGYTRKDLEEGVHALQLFHPEDRERVEQNIKKRLTGVDFEDHEYIGIKKDGSTFPLLIYTSPIIRDEKMVGVRGIVLDITERKQTEEALRKARDEMERQVAERTVELSKANEQMRVEIEARKILEKELRESEEQLMLAMEATQDGLWDWNITEDKLLFSARLKELLGFEKDEQIPDSMDYWLSRVHPDYLDRFNQFKEGLKDRESSNITFLYLLKNGDYRWFNSRSIVLFNEKGTPYRMVGSFRDIDKEKQAEELIRNLTQSLITSQENERQMISRELHDSVAQDLSSSRIICEMISQNKSFPPEISKQISEVSRNLHKSLKSVRDLSYELRPPGLEKFGLERTLYLLCNEFSEKTGIRVDFQAAGVEHLNLNYTKKINLYRLLQEGLNNVRKHADANNITVRLVSSFPNVILRINDDGKGFDMKERLAKTSSEKRMGLHNMKERVGLLQGRVNIESSPGNGTKVVIEIPQKYEKI